MGADRGGRAWLEEVRVQDLALLESVELSLSEGLNVVSGETGEGKSLLLAAITLLLGARARRGLVRRGAASAVVEGRFRLQGIDLSGVTDLVASDADEVCLRRVVAADGASRAYLDGALVPVGLLARLGAGLVDVHGQRHSLLRPSDQRAVLDRFAGVEADAVRWGELHGQLLAVRDDIASLEVDAAGRAERLEFARFQLQELEDAAPVAGEESELTKRLKILASAGDLEAILGDAAAALQERDGAAGETCARLSRRLEDTGAADSGPLHVLLERVRSLGIEADDVGRECASLRDDLDADPKALERVEARITLLRGLARRHHVEPDALPDRVEVLRAEVASFDGGDDPELALRRQEASLIDELLEIGRGLWTARRKAAKRLERAIAPALAELKMERARVRVSIEPETWSDDLDPGTAGADGPGTVGLLVAANPGEPEQPLERIASGGELARVLLAVKGALAGAHRIPLLIFDEIDAGIGGRVGMTFGKRIASISRHHQVLVVTHLPQVAAFADRHLGVQKEVRGGRTRTRVVTLEGKERIREVAAMLGGADAGRAAEVAATTQAEALIEEAAS
ncbi:MAG: DNA repair protein RecN [Planctomycetes bacterium]|nr:DNA repair protein RecN [Planctomycetota bacterium]